MSVVNRIAKIVRENELLYSTMRTVRDTYSYTQGNRNGTFSQHGEDIFILKRFAHKPTGFYVDVGASHPFRLSNTFLLYQTGWRGVTVEPIPLLGRLHKKWRPEDVLVPKAIGPAPGRLVFYEMLPSVLSTLDAKTAQTYMADGAQVLRTYPIEVITLDQLFATYVGQRAVDLLSIDLEGLDTATIATFALAQIRPAIICIEANHADDRQAMLTYFAQHDYALLTDLGCNVLVEDARSSGV
jgi:FkbM family methyltransferase